MNGAWAFLPSYKLKPSLHSKYIYAQLLYTVVVKGSIFISKDIKENKMVDVNDLLACDTSPVLTNMLNSLLVDDTAFSCLYNLLVSSGRGNNPDMPLWEVNEGNHADISILLPDPSCMDLAPHVLKSERFNPSVM